MKIPRLLLVPLLVWLGTAPTAGARWTLSTDDTCIELAVSDDTIRVETFKNQAQGWNWTPAPSEVPLPGKSSVRAGATDYTPHWKFRGATEDRSDGYTLTLRFTSAKPDLELKSIWRAQDGPGPVENWITIENQSAAPVTFHASIAAGRMRVRVDRAASLLRIEKTAVGKGRAQYDGIGPNATFRTGSDSIPLVMLDAGTMHGAYWGFEWELGGFSAAAGPDPLDIVVSALPLTDDVTSSPHETFTIPSVYYGTYRGDIDDGSNRFKRWFWNYKITRSLHDHADEPWTEVCMQEFGGRGSST